MNKLLSFLIMLLLASNLIFSQATDNIKGASKYHLPEYDSVKFRIGFSGGFTVMFFNIKTASDMNTRMYYETNHELGDLWVDSAMILAVGSIPGYGFNIGLHLNRKVSRSLDLRFIPTLAFGDRTITYSILEYKGNDCVVIDSKKNIQSVLINLPLILDYGFKRHNNAMTYVFIGGQYSLDTQSNAKKRDIEPQYTVKLKRDDFYALAGVGIDLYRPSFKMGFEICFMYGFCDLLHNDDNIYTESIEGLNSRIFNINITFM